MPNNILDAERRAYERFRQGIKEPQPFRPCALCGKRLTDEDFKYCSDECRQVVAEARRPRTT